MLTVAVAAVSGAVLALVIGLLLGLTKRAREGATTPQAMSFAGAAILGFFALFLGFSIAGTWQQLNSARQHTYEESRALTEAYWTAGGLPDADRPVVRDRLRSYTRVVIDDEWAAMQHDTGSQAAWRAVDQVRAAVDRAAVHSQVEASARTDVLRSLSEVNAKRNARLGDLRASVPVLAIGGLLVGAVFVLATPSVIGLTSNPRNLVLMCFVGASVAFGVSMVAVMSGPFSGAVRIQPTAFQLALERYDQIDNDAGVSALPPFLP
ncbi:bestrophin-like domain [Kitasatospora cineracea]